MPHPFQIVDQNLDGDGRAPKLGIRDSRPELGLDLARFAPGRACKHGPMPLIVPF